MNKEEILAKSRAENKNQDIYEKEVLKLAAKVSSGVLMLFVILFLILQIIAGNGINYGLLALESSIYMSTHWVKFLYLKKKEYLYFAIAETVFVLASSAAHIYDLFSII